MLDCIVLLAQYGTNPNIPLLLDSDTFDRYFHNDDSLLHVVVKIINSLSARGGAEVDDIIDTLFQCGAHVNVKNHANLLPLNLVRSRMSSTFMKIEDELCESVHNTLVIIIIDILTFIILLAS